MTDFTETERWANHRREHETIADAVGTAHISATAALKAALSDHHREHEVHAAAHEREHIAHSREHVLNDQSVATAAHSVDKRLESMNEVRQQLRDQTAAFASAERVEQFIKDTDRRFTEASKHTDDKYENNRLRIETLEKGDVKQAGKQMGQGAVVAIIVTAITVVGTILGIIIVIANAITAV